MPLGADSTLAPVLFDAGPVSVSVSIASQENLCRSEYLNPPPMATAIDQDPPNRSDCFIAWAIITEVARQFTEKVTGRDISSISLVSKLAP